MSSEQQLPCTFLEVEGGYLLRLMKGAPVMHTLEAFLARQEIYGGVISAIGALEAVELGYFHREKREYQRRKFSGVYELVSFTGNISRVEGKPFVHAHAVLSDAEYRPIGGHFFEGIVAVTVEAYIRRLSGNIRRTPDEETGLKLLDFDR